MKRPKSNFVFDLSRFLMRLCQFIFQSMDNHQLKFQIEKTMKKDSPLTLSVLNLPPKTQLLSMPSPSADYKLYHHIKRKINLSACSAVIPKAKLFSNLELYEWRKQTDFPIVKTRYISVKNQASNHSDKVQIQIFNEYCPLKLNRMYEMSISQALYIIKECLIGFQRLFNRFGGFEITEAMISINERGYCRVWINQNFYLNSYTKLFIKESNMVHQIINIIQSHCVESKNSKRLFTALQKCSNFLQALKMVDAFVVTEKIMVPSRFTFLTCKESKKQTMIDSPYFIKSVESIDSQQNIFGLNQRNDEQKYKNKEKSAKKFNTSLQSQSSQLKRIKSEEKVTRVYDMKISAGETACSTNYKDIKNSNLVNQHFLQSRDAFLKPATKSNRSQQSNKWGEESSFTLDLLQPKPNQKQKKQLSQSQAAINDAFNQKNRKYSGKIIQPGSQTPSLSYYNFPTKKSQNEYLSKAQICNDEETSKTIQTTEEQKKIQHSFRIIEENGWKNNFTQMLESPKNLKQSVYAGGEEEQSPLLKQVKLEKLGSLGRRKIAMSILPEQCPEDYQ